MHVLRCSSYLQSVLPSCCISLQRVQQMMTTTINCNAIPDQSICIFFVLYSNICTKKRNFCFLLDWLLKFPPGKSGRWRSWIQDVITWDPGALLQTILFYWVLGSLSVMGSKRNLMEKQYPVDRAGSLTLKCSKLRNTNYMDIFVISNTIYWSPMNWILSQYFWIALGLLH